MAKGKGNYHKVKTPFKHAHSRNIPYSIRLAQQRELEIGDEREDAALIALYIALRTLHKTEGLGIERLTKLSIPVTRAIVEFYKSNTIDVERHNLIKGLRQRGIDTSALGFRATPLDYVEKAVEGLDGYKKELATRKAIEIYRNRQDAAMCALAMLLVIVGDELGYGEQRLNRVATAISEACKAYYSMPDLDEARKQLENDLVSVGFLLTEDGKLLAVIDEDGNPVKKGSALWQSCC